MKNNICFSVVSMYLVSLVPIYELISIPDRFNVVVNLQLLINNPLIPSSKVKDYLQKLCKQIQISPQNHLPINHHHQSLHPNQKPLPNPTDKTT